jgi:Domain of unknown function (DUF4114)
MASIGLGQTITGSLTSDDSKYSSSGYSYDRYDFTGLDDYRQLTINITRDIFKSFEVILRNTVTGEIVAAYIDDNGAGKGSLTATTFPGIEYQVEVNGGGNGLFGTVQGNDLGNYTLSTVDGGKATAIATTDKSQLSNLYSPVGVGTVGADGKFFALASGNGLSDVALSSTGQFYGVSSNILLRIDPSKQAGKQIEPANGILALSTIKDRATGFQLTGNIDAIEYVNDKLYALVRTTTNDKIYTIDTTTPAIDITAGYTATLVGDLPTEFVINGDDFVYDAANNRFLATALGTPENDALWQIPIANPAGATKIGSIGFTGLTALAFENGQLTGISTKSDGTSTKIAINPTTGAGTLGKVIPGITITGSSTIVGANTTNPSSPNVSPTPGTPAPTSLFSTDGSFQGLGFRAVSQKSSSKVNEIAAFYVDDTSGKIGNLAPGSAGYLKAAIDRATPIFSTLGGSFFDSTSRKDVGLDTGKLYQFFEIKDGTVADLQQQFSTNSNFSPPNLLLASDPSNPIKLTENTAKDGYQISINNDELVLNVTKLTNAPIPPIGSKSQYLAQGRTLDLTDYTNQNLKVDIATKSDAVYSNNIGFYQVEDTNGTIKLADGSSIGVTDARYAVEAVKKALSNTLLTANKTDSKLDRTIAGGAIYAPVVIAKGTLDDFIKAGTNTGDANAIHAYFNYVGANPDKIDHFRLLGNNTFGVEDMYGGGDRDFNDLVISLNVKTS